MQGLIYYKIFLSLTYDFDTDDLPQSPPKTARSYSLVDEPFNRRMRKDVKEPFDVNDGIARLDSRGQIIAVPC